jgi:L-iditol 2-dehydrogenase
MNTKMFAVVYHAPQDIRVEQVSVPDIGAEEILLRVETASICGTDLRIFHGEHRKYTAGTIRIPGHEVVGTIAALGSAVQGYHAGDRVFVAPNMGCGHCRQCVSGKNNLCANYQAIGVTIDGGFAEYMRIPSAAVRQGNVIPIGNHIDPAVAALTEPFACVLRGQNAIGIQPGDRVLIFGAGPIGIMHIKLALARGASQVIVSEPAVDRAEQARRMGAHDVVIPGQEDVLEAVNRITQGLGADAVIVAAPAQAAQEAALQLAAVGGRINFFGGLPKNNPEIRFDSNLVHYKELVVTGTTACSTRDCWQANEIITSGLVNLDDLISQRFPLSQALTAFAAAEDRKALKIVIEPNGAKD